MDSQTKRSPHEPSHSHRSKCRNPVYPSEDILGPDHPNIATSLSNLAGLYYTQGNYERAEPVFKRALAIQEKALGPDHPHMAGSLENLAALYRATNRKQEAEKLEQRAARIRATLR